jgi:sporulation protein YlmC with PRC-barrel domain
MDDAPDGWESVGEIGDVMVSSEGEVNSVVVDSGGFLGMGERNSRISMDQMQFVRDTNDEGEYFVVFTGDRAALEGVDVYDADRMRADGYQSTLDMRMANNQLAYTNARDNRETWASVDWSTMTTEDLTGVQVNGSNDNWVGEISELVLGDDGKTITHAVIDVGGWLGIGERPVAMTFEQIDLRRDADNDSVIAYVDATEEELENMPEWER